MNRKINHADLVVDAQFEVKPKGAFPHLLPGKLFRVVKKYHEHSGVSGATYFDFVASDGQAVRRWSLSTIRTQFHKIKSE